jgi:hypothetical protein
MIQKTLAEMARAVSYQAGIKTGSGTTFRHSIEDLYPEINSAFVENQEESVARLSSFYTVEGGLANLPARVTSDNYGLIDFPADTHAIGRIDVLVDGEWDKLLPIEWDNMRDVMPSGRNASSRRPTHYSVRSIGSVTAATVAAGKIAILPFCSSGQYKMSTLPTWVPITNTAHIFIFPSESAFRWTVQNVLARVATRDPKGGQRFEKALKGQQLAESRMGRTGNRKLGGAMRRAARRWG